MCADLLGDDQGLLVRDGLHLAGAEGVGGGAVISQVELGAHQDDGDAGGVVFDLREPLNCGHVSRIYTVLPRRSRGAGERQERRCEAIIPWL